MCLEREFITAAWAGRAQVQGLALALDQRLAAMQEEQEAALGTLREFFNATLSQASPRYLPPAPQ